MEETSVLSLQQQLAEEREAKQALLEKNTTLILLCRTLKAEFVTLSETNKSLMADAEKLKQVVAKAVALKQQNDSLIQQLANPNALPVVIELRQQIKFLKEEQVKVMGRALSE